MEAFCAEKKKVRGEWVPLPNASSWVDDWGGVTINKNRVAHN